MSKNAKTERAALSDREFTVAVARVSSTGIAVNVLLAAFKFIAGVVGRSGAMISDAVHSLSDILGGLTVIAGARLSGRESDAHHPYGHERMESAASIILSGILAAAGIAIGVNAVNALTSGEYQSAMPGVIALVAAILSVVTKELLFHYTRIQARRLNSESLGAEAWHHRSDALSSLGSLVGVGGARLGWPALEPVASLVICGFIIKAAFDIFREAIDKLLDRACAPEEEQAMREFVMSIPGVEGVDLLRTREFGRRVYVDLEIRADGDQTLRQAHSIAENVHTGLEKQFPDVKHVMVHVNPD